MKEDLPGYEKDIQVEDTSLIAENKKQNLKSVQKRVTPIPKKNCKRKCIVPQPFSLSTEKRISKMISSLQGSTPSLSRSLSFKMFDEITERGLEVDRGAYNALMGVIVRVGDLKDRVEIIM